MGHVGADIHQVADACTTLSFGIALEEFPYLEEKHDEDGLRKLCLGTWQKTNGQCSQRGY